MVKLKLKEIFVSIKSDKEMSLDHWRYKILHWTFGLDRDGHRWGKIAGERYRYDKRSLPNSLYTHYCPLFHFTNALAILSPLTLSFKIFLLFVQFLLFSIITIYKSIVKASKFIGYCLILLGRFIVSIIKLREKWFGKAAKKLEKKAKKEKQPQYKNVWKTLAQSMRKLQHLSGDPNLLKNFSQFWKYHGWTRSTFGKSKSEVKKIWDEIQLILEKERIRAEKKRKKLQDRIIFWVNLSRGLIKGLFNLLYIGLFACVLFLLWTYGTIVVFGAIGYIVIACTWVVSFNWWEILGSLKTGAGYLGIVLTGLIMLFLMILSVALLGRKFVHSIEPSKLQTVLLPYTVTRDITYGLGRYTGGIFVWCTEFVRMFYEENCPAITIVESDK